jgi:hypothetical protein
VVPLDPTLPPPGWHPDPDRPGSQRWFDGSEWISSAKASEVRDPNVVVERDWVGAIPETLRRQELVSSNTLVIPRESEPGYDGGGGWQAPTPCGRDGE